MPFKFTCCQVLKAKICLWCCIIDLHLLFCPVEISLTSKTKKHLGPQTFWRCCLSNVLTCCDLQGWKVFRYHCVAPVQIALVFLCGSLGVSWTSNHNLIVIARCLWSSNSRITQTSCADNSAWGDFSYQSVNLWGLAYFIWCQITSVNDLKNIVLWFMRCIHYGFFSWVTMWDAYMIIFSWGSQISPYRGTPATVLLAKF